MTRRLNKLMAAVGKRQLQPPRFRLQAFPSHARFWLVRSLLRQSVCLAAGLLAATLGAQTPPNSVPSQESSQLVTAEGSVEISLAGAADWRTATTNQLLRIGDRLRTGKRSRATVRLSDLSIFRINELTTLQIQPPLQRDKKPLLDLKSGSVYFLSREKPEEIQFRTPVVVGAIAYAVGPMVSVFLALGGVILFSIGGLLIGMRLWRPSAASLPSPMAA